MPIQKRKKKKKKKSENSNLNELQTPFHKRSNILERSYQI